MAVARCAAWAVSPSNRLTDLNSNRLKGGACLSESPSAWRVLPGSLSSSSSSKACPGFFGGDSNTLLFSPANGVDRECFHCKSKPAVLHRCSGRGISSGHFRACAAPSAAPSVNTSSPDLAVESLEPLLATEPQPSQTIAKAFAPATVANLGPGFDFLGCAVQGLGDHVVAELSDHVPPGEVEIESIEGDGGRLSLLPLKNCAGIAAKATLRLLGVRSVGITLRLLKGLPLGSGLGSSAASAAAAACAVNGLFGSPLSGSQLVTAGLISEAAVSGYHADNIAPSILGGFVLVRSMEPLEIIPLPWGSARATTGQDAADGGDARRSSPVFVIVSPAFEAPTKEMRAVLPMDISMKSHINNSTQGAALVAAILQGDAKLLGAAMASDGVVEPRRIRLIPGMAAVKISAMMAGSFGCTISGAGPTAVAVTDSREKGEAIGQAMQNAFQAVGKLSATVSVQELDTAGARLVDLRQVSRITKGGRAIDLGSNGMEDVIQLSVPCVRFERSRPMPSRRESALAGSKGRALTAVQCMHCCMASSTWLAPALGKANAMRLAAVNLRQMRESGEGFNLQKHDDDTTAVLSAPAAWGGKMEAPVTGNAIIGEQGAEGGGGGGGGGGGRGSSNDSAQELMEGAPLLQALHGLACNDDAPFHFPGHKRGLGSPSSFVEAMGESMLRHDLPELPELDNLFAPEGVIKDAQVKAAEVFGAEATWFLVNGSTCGLQAAVLATCRPGDCLVLPRNAHQSTFSAMVLAGATPRYIVPDYDAYWGICTGVSAEDVETCLVDAIEKNGKSRVGGVLIVSPTYKGLCSDVRGIASVCHRYGVPLIVDEAHGGHFAFHSALPPPALFAGADICVQSTHKVLSSLTQSAMLHAKGDRVSHQRISKALQVLQSSSPSYLLLSSLDAARAQMTSGLDGKGVRDSPLLENALKLASRCRWALKQMPGLDVLGEGSLRVRKGLVAGLDPLRITVHVAGLGLSGFQVDDILREELAVVAELPTPKTLTFAVSAGTTEKHTQALIDAFKELSRRYSSRRNGLGEAIGKLAVNGEGSAGLAERNTLKEDFLAVSQGYSSSSVDDFEIPHDQDGASIGTAEVVMERQTALGHGSINTADGNEGCTSASELGRCCDVPDSSSAVGKAPSDDAGPTESADHPVKLHEPTSPSGTGEVLGEKHKNAHLEEEEENGAEVGKFTKLVFCAQSALSPREAFFAPSERVKLEEAVGRICAELLAPYPPGIPVLAPGEVITREALDCLVEVVSSGGSVSGALESDFRTIAVVS
ncbi:hypothetical protein CBR_g2798 [Chara braunii]|uniref:Homoserine kinase n=1 Tax=Chara braunii TaxID=69332 RepID=A0A388KE16_CHABU|nr:hypothetical protein CBR_g2798 [Chara braunii]|eukprot:GBG68247.1 hypothetical protein CBR_g2798 [Chara braunii]